MKKSQTRNSITRFLLNVFPVPNLLKMKKVGIDISDTSIRYIELEESKNGKYVKNFGEIKLPTGTITSGYINKSDEVVKALSEIKKQTKSVFARVSLPEEKAYFFNTQMPNMEERELREAVGFRIEENVPLSAKDSIYDYTIIPSHSDTEHINVIVSVVPSKVSETYAEVIRRAGFLPTAFEISSQAIGRAIASHSDESHLVVNFTENKTTLSIINKGTVLFTSTIPIGSTSLNEEIMNKFSIPLEKVQEIKSEAIISGKQDMDLFIEMMNKMKILQEELIKFITYWRTHSINIIQRQSTINKIILCGRDMMLPAIDEYVYGITGIKTEVANVWQNVFSFEDYIPPINKTDSLDFVVAIGLAI